MAFLNKGLEIRFIDERDADGQRTTFKYNGGIVDFVKHLNSSRESLFRKVASFEQSENSMEVEVALQWNTGFHESLHSFANGISTTEGGMHEEGFKKALTNVVNRYARAQEHPEGEGREPARRGHPGGAHRDRLGAAQRPAVRGPDEGEARATSRCARSSSGRPTRSWPSGSRRTRARPTRRCRRRCSLPGRGSRRARPGTSPGASRRSTARGFRASSSTAPRATHGSASCSSSRATPPGARPRTPATRGPRRSCRSGARSSTSNGPASTRC